MKIKFFFIIIVTLTFKKSIAQYQYQSRVLEEFNISRYKGDYYGIIKNGEEFKSLHVFNNNGVDSILLLQINNFLSIAYNEVRYYDRIKLLYKEVEKYKFVYNDTAEIKKYFSVLCNITQGLIQMHDLQQARIVYDKSEKIYNPKTFESWRYVNMVKNKIAILYENGQSDLAEKLILETIKKINNINVTFNIYIDLVSCYFDNNNLTAAESTIFEVLDLYIKQDSIYKAENSLDSNYKPIFNHRYQLILSQLSRLYRFKSDFNNMLITDEKILKLSRQNSLSPRDLSLSLIGLAYSFMEVNKIDKAIQLCNEAVSTIEKFYGKNSPELIEILDSYGMVLEPTNINEALKVYLKACEIAENQNEYYDNMESAFNSVSRIYTRPNHKNRSPDSSLVYSRKAYNIVRKFFPESSETYIEAISNIAFSFGSMNYYDSSIYYHLLAKNLYEKYNYIESYLYKSEIFCLAIQYKASSRNNEAILYFNKWISYWRTDIKNNFYVLINDIDKAEEIRRNFELYDYYAQRINDQQMFKISFENKILLKNLQLNQYSELKREIKKNKEAQDIFKKINLLSSSDEEQRELFELKTKLYNTLPIYGYIENSFSISLDDCKRNLKDGDALIEFGKYNYIYSDDGQESDFYFALILRNDKNEVSYVPLGFEADINKFLDSKDHDINSLYQYSYQGLYDFLIRPIVNNLKGINSIYISSAGILNKFNLSALLSESYKTLSEKFHVFVISSTSEFVNPEKRNNNISKIDKIYSYGGIDYGNTQTNIYASQYFSRSGVSKWSYLPGTLSEVNFIDSLFRKNRIKSVKYSGENATELSIYKLVSTTSPYILHIASHGFFLSNNQTNSNLDPLNLTGVLFSGANNNWNKNKITTKDSLDGILLGSELCDIDLSNCSLAILSACETGVGKIMNNEGVFGLQRALKLAGVKQCIVSLWKVPDQQTSELFKLFYINFINGDNIHDSFYKAQISMKEKYVLPIYWAGFVLIE